MARTYLLCLLTFLSACDADPAGRDTLETGGSEKEIIFSLYPPGQAPWQKRCFVDGDSNSTRYVMGKARRYQGVWTRGFELSSFDENTQSTGSGKSASIWLDITDMDDTPEYAPSNDATYEVAFIGQEPICDRDSIGHGFGHMEGSDRLVSVKQILSIRRLAHR